jgi:hypothetical protein
MQTVQLTEEEWQKVLLIISNTRDFPWTTTNPLLMRMGEQLNKQTVGKQTNNAEMPVDKGEVHVKQ